MDSFTEAWDYICHYCRERIAEVAYQTWISRIKPINMDFSSGIAVLEVPNEFHKKTLQRCYFHLLQEAFSKFSVQKLKFVCFCRKSYRKKKKRRKKLLLTIMILHLKLLSSVLQINLPTPRQWLLQQSLPPYIILFYLRKFRPWKNAPSKCDP